jgi:7-cyano-7-deazaguanine synthase
MQDVRSAPPFSVNSMKRTASRSPKKAIVLLSGGLDSATVLYHARAKGYSCHCLAFDYGQRHKRELNAARRLARAAGCPCQVVKIRLPWKGSSLLDPSQKIPVNMRPGPSAVLPSTYVPGRNTIFISFALSYAETIGASVVFIGANAVDFSGYPDCRPAYYAAFNTVLKALGTNVRIEVPLLRLTKKGIVELGIRLGVPYRLTWSCYQGGKKPCGVCDSCRFRAKGFAQAGIADAALTADNEKN